ncbi:MAG: N-acetylmuramoyl-L-alanine amidase [Acidobacteria bacterium]|nr:N-acetylmuramoyl-L-alanine amidase [Acidobacteriota bacterium]
MGSRIVSWCGVAVLAFLVAGAGRPPHRLEIVVAPGELIVWNRGEPPQLFVQPKKGDGWYALARRYCGRASFASALRAANGGRSGPRRGVAVAVPVETLRGDLRLRVVRRLFPMDRRVRDGWRHWALDPFRNGEESWRWLAGLFTGRQSNAAILRRVNPELPEGGPPRGSPVLIPEAHLLPVFRRVPLPATPTPTPTPTPTLTPTPSPTPRAPTPASSASVKAVERAAVGAGSARVGGGGLEVAGTRNTGVLSYGRDTRGRYAIYHLRRGEALYSAVVVRFTGQLHAAEVNATAAIIARRSGIRDVTSIPVGYPVKIPLDLLRPQYLPKEDPRRVQWERDRLQLRAFVERVRAVDLSGIHVILDAGHGNVDCGATVDGVWESTYAYDILCRIKRNLERHTKATVWATIKDLSRGYAVVDRDRLVQDRDQILLTHPPFKLTDTKTGVHLRWYLANDIVLGREKRRVPPSRIVFLSIHADSLHPSVRGTMIYVPARHLRPSSFSVRRRSLQRYAEYRRHPRVKLGKRFRARAEASSRQLATQIIVRLRRDGLEVHPYQPVRGSVLRGRRRWVPAVLRYSLAQNAILVECCNLANREDRTLLLSARWRERFARAVVQGLAADFDGSTHP